MITAPPRVVPSLLRQMNERRILSALQTEGPASRANLGRRTGISGPTVTRVIATLLEARLVEEIDEPRQRSVGRPGKIVRLARSGVGVLGVVVGSQQTEVIVSGLDGQIDDASVRTFATPHDYDELLTACTRAARELARRREGAILGVGLSVPGLLNRHDGRSIVSPNVHQLDGHRLGDDLKAKLQLDVAVLQECDALCWAERTYGAARDAADFAILDISEGLGLGVMQEGRIVHGKSGLAGELGHITVALDGKPCGCGNRGCLETVATDRALAAAVGSRLQRRIGIEEIVAGVRSGTLDCERELDEVLEYLAVATAAVINIFNPGKLFIYGRLLDARDDLFAQLLERAERRTLAPSWADCEVVRARGNKRLGVLAVACHDATHGRPE